ncbi:DUF1846 domain-containing protein [Actinomycetaceae bacterium WB03_NA08]|uniref:UPF0371 protein FYJ24_11715 n=1 Tax=Scrofimicrobium canadense TaxID=2652290 RepID=A0A6N7VUE9_9ACTO|nr:DUF1846 domain-containing protein [Scrofimicrobium canadense]MSS85397.1 DUF1846 domain-containing protein [Scrofimicrobium canadense]
MAEQGSGFDREKYISLQTEHIEARRRQFGGKLYLEFGGKLFDDMHASRVLPGFLPDNKILMLEAMKDEAEVVVVVSAKDIASRKVRGDLGIPYDVDVLRLIDEFRSYGLFVSSVVISQITGDDRGAKEFRRKLQRLGLKVYRHYSIDGYPHDIPHIIGEHGYGKNEYIETSRDLVVVTAPGPGSGKMATCLSQLYHDNVRGISSGYAKFETFPIWNLPLDHPVNVAYEAATADLDDVNMIDPYHLAAYGEQAINYNRDVEIFPVLNVLFERILGESPYKSPTDMGVNMAGYCISNDEVCRQASKQEIIRRYFKARVDEVAQSVEPVVSDRIALLMGQMGITVHDRPVVDPACDLAKTTKGPAAAMELPDGSIVLGKTSALLGSSSALLLNALKKLANIDPEIDLLAAATIKPIQELKTKHLGSKNPRLHTDEVLIALAVAATTDPHAQLAMDQLPHLRGLDVHTSVILGSVDEGIFRSLGVQVTSEPVFQSKKLYRKR